MARHATPAWVVYAVTPTGRSTLWIDKNPATAERIADSWRRLGRDIVIEPYQ